MHLRKDHAIYVSKLMSQSLARYFLIVLLINWRSMEQSVSIALSGHIPQQTELTVIDEGHYVCIHA